MEKRNHMFRDISLRLFFFLVAAFFCTCRVLVTHNRSVKGTLVICQKGPLFGTCFELKYRTSTLSENKTLFFILRALGRKF